MNALCKCGNSFTRHNTLQVRCYECELKLKREKDGNGSTGRKTAIQRKVEKVDKGTDNRKSRVQRLLRDKGETKGKKNDIANRSKSQESKDREIARIKATLIKKHGYWCQSCGSNKDIDASHLIPKSVRPDLYTEEGNISLMCRLCHESYEHLQDMERVRRFINLDVILAYLERTDTKRYLRVMEKLKINV